MSIENKKFTLDSREAQLKRPTHEVTTSIAEYENQSIAVDVVDAREKSSETDEVMGRTIIWPQSYASRMDEFEKQRQVTIAEALKARVVAIENPGVGISHEANTTFWQKLDLLKGNFDLSAHAMLGALNEIVDFKKNEEVEFMLYSQGVALGASMLNDLGSEAFGLKLKVPKITIIEAVNDQPWNLMKLLPAIGSEDKATNRYLAENEKYDWLLPPNDRTAAGKIERTKLDKLQNASLLLGGAALRKPFTPTLINAINRDRADNTTGISRAQIDMLKFDASGVSRLEANQLTANQLRMAMPLGFVSLTMIDSPNGEGHYHPAIHSMPNMDVISRKLVK